MDRQQIDVVPSSLPMPQKNANHISDSASAFEGQASLPHYDLIMLGFGPASLSIAIAIKEKFSTASKPAPRVLILEKGDHFSWHSGLLLPGAHMQISFMKDLATFRSPQSKFTFLNYLHSQGRLAKFINLNTFTPLRVEFQAYLAWCARTFIDEGWAQFQQEALSVQAIKDGDNIVSWQVSAQNPHDASITRYKTKKVVVATGGQFNLPQGFPKHLLDSQITHSSHYLPVVTTKFRDCNAKYNFAVIGGGQSAAEIWDDLSERFKNANVELFTKGAELKISDDSPFVNEIFDHDRVKKFYAQDRPSRCMALKRNKSTNYGVVRVELLESMYEKLYRQQFLNPSPSQWRIHIREFREVLGADLGRPGARIGLRIKNVTTGIINVTERIYDGIFLATGYSHNLHETILKPLDEFVERDEEGKIGVNLDYSIKFKNQNIRSSCGIWLQGLCEETHGLSDSLLSILALRAGQIADSIFDTETPGAVKARL